jgi:hypothetical protein
VVGLADPLDATNQTGFLTEIDEALQDRPHRLEVRSLEKGFALKGQFVCSGPEGPFDFFEILIVIEWGFPFVEPLVWETAKRIPRDPDRHIYSASGQCCICIWEEWLWTTDCANFQSFVDGPLNSYFVSQSLFELKGQWVFGERRHGKDGIIDAYRRILKLGDQEDVSPYVCLLRHKKIKGHNICPCGSGKKLRHCHHQFMLDLKEQIPAFLLERMMQRIKGYSEPEASKGQAQRTSRSKR